MDKLFEQVGRRGTICSDGGPPFRSKEFKDYLSVRNIRQRLSSPLYPESNGIAENSVKQGKRLLVKCVENKEDISTKLFHFNSTRISGRFVPFILVRSPLRLGPSALGMDKVEQVVGVGVPIPKMDLITL